MAGRFLQHVWQLWMAITYGATPFEWFALIVSLIVESLFIFVVVLFEGGEWRHRGKTRKHLKAIAPLLREGHNLLASFPADYPHPSDRTFEWVALVESWSDRTEVALYLISPFAAQAFSFAFDKAANERVVRRRNHAPLLLSGELGDSYQIFQSRLRNLQQIVAKPEVYL